MQSAAVAHVVHVQYIYREITPQTYDSIWIMLNGGSYTVAGIGSFLTCKADGVIFR
jgi:hypothetical protein